MRSGHESGSNEGGSHECLMREESMRCEGGHRRDLIEIHVVIFISEH